VLPRPDVRLGQALPRFSSVAFGAMVVIVMTGIAQNWRQLGSLQALAHTMYGCLLVGKVAVFLLLMGFGGYSRALVRRKLTARAFVGAAASHQHAGGTRACFKSGGVLWDAPGMGRGDLTNEQWARLEPLLPKGIKSGRPPTWSKRQLIDGIRWRTRTGAPWRDVPARYGPWQTVYGLFRRWQRDGTWQRILSQLQARLMPTA
jgi:Putative transposase of IS4/5 family (DUF4096)/Copper resistance protein D